MFQSAGEMVSYAAQLASRRLAMSMPPLLRVTIQILGFLIREGYLKVDLEIDNISRTE